MAGILAAEPMCDRHVYHTDYEMVDPEDREVPAI